MAIQMMTLKRKRNKQDELTQALMKQTGFYSEFFNGEIQFYIEK
jgi:hypothetical protein